MRFKSTISLFRVKNLIKSLRQKLTAGAPFSSRQLHEAGVSNALAAKYVRSGWLERLERGVYQFAGDRLDRDQTLRFLEGRMSGLHGAGKSALVRHGYRQNLAFDERVIVWCEGRAQLPEWAEENFRLRFGTRHLFDGNLPFADRVSRLPGALDGPMVSQPEPALLEMLSEVGVTEGVEESKNIMESMIRIRTSRMCRAITSCQMVKAVRLCAVWAAELKLEWAEAAGAAVPADKRKGRWVGTLNDGKTLTLPEL
jgi:hypothetical protein